MTDENTPNSPKNEQSPELAANLIRSKIETIYSNEPNAKEEAVQELEKGTDVKRSKHQQYMFDLTTSGKSLADIQTAWHSYYVSLPDDQKHEVWEEFYQNHSSSSHYERYKPLTGSHPETYHHKKNSVQNPKNELETSKHSSNHKKTIHQPQTVAEIQQKIIKKVNAEGKLKTRHHLQSIAFGLAVGSIVVLIFLFGFFNERFIAPFISPSRNVTNTPIINDGSTVAANSDPKIIIPKINVEIPVVYDEPSIDEKAIQTALERGVVHYANTADPGQNGNVVVVGHSSNNIFNKGQYKFAFVLLSKLEAGDTFVLNKDGVRYTYRVYDKKIVKPTDVGVMQPTEKTATVTLITCDPPGTSINRLVVVGEQISPSVTANKPADVNKQAAASQSEFIPGNAPSLWSRLTDWL